MGLVPVILQSNARCNRFICVLLPQYSDIFQSLNLVIFIAFLVCVLASFSLKYKK